MFFSFAFVCALIHGNWNFIQYNLMTQLSFFRYSQVTLLPYPWPFLSSPVEGWLGLERGPWSELARSGGSLTYCGDWNGSRPESSRCLLVIQVSLSKTFIIPHTISFCASWKWTLRPFYPSCHVSCSFLFSQWITSSGSRIIRSG